MPSRVSRIERREVVKQLDEANSMNILELCKLQYSNISS
jgi:hypothetical protein